MCFICHLYGSTFFLIFDFKPHPHRNLHSLLHSTFLSFLSYFYCTPKRPPPSTQHKVKKISVALWNIIFPLIIHIYKLLYSLQLILFPEKAKQMQLHYRLQF